MHALHMLIRLIHNQALSAALLACYAILVIWSRSSCGGRAPGQLVSDGAVQHQQCQGSPVLRDTSESSL